ncbi:restriction endonuclease subunit S [Pseudoalteromonas distincta]|mgnify:FL=1|uniref:restriction endonuclease subunit S n=1 Tax=Pseudoalteromonas distincta TaxID=77608 RepID=UPI00241F97A6|nr:restriction endonuclease subunit S [Pseudoalteromonas distincta]|tara:strand:- start:22573 stop:24393 length:1821 start_codon:yes stop_codon:yes gene_type:complete
MAETKAPNTSAEQLITDHLDIWTTAIEQKSSAGRGSSKKFSLHGIKKLRELILELAVRGKLVPQDPNDEPASVLLERIADEKAQLVKDKKIKKPKVLPEISDDDKPFELPRSWEFVRFNDLGEWGAGSTPRRGNIEYYNGSIPWFKSGELNSDYISESEEHISELALKETSVRYNNIGDVLVAMYGATIGKTSILSVRATTNQAVCACTPFNGFKNTFLLMLLKASKSRLTGMGAGGAQPNISREKIINTVIALPPTSEQQRIVAKVDELMGLCDALEAQTENSITAHQTLVEVLLDALLKAPEQGATPEQATAQFQQNWQRLSEHFDTLFTTTASIDMLKQTILQLAVMGKLVPQNPDDEPAAKLLERIAAEKAQLIKDKKIKKQKPLPEITDEEKLYELPSGWVWSRFGDLFKSFSNGLYKPSKFYTDEGVISLRMYNIQNGYIDFAGAKRVEVEPTELAQFILEPNDLLINRVNSKELVGKTAIIPELEEPLVYESMNMRAKPFIEHLSAQYLNLFMMTKVAQNFISSFAKEAVGQASINQGQVSSIVIPLPPFKEQQHIVAKVDELMTLCDQLKVRLTDAETTKLHLTDIIVKSAVFEGKKS